MIICLALFVAKIQGPGFDAVATLFAGDSFENIPTDQFMASQPQLAGPACDDEQFTQCANQFVKDIGMPSFPKSAGDLALYVGKLLTTKRAAGFEQLCTGVNGINTCLGDQVESCFSAQHLASLGISPGDIMSYRMMQASWTSACGSGYDAIYKNFDCMMDFPKQHGPEFVKCTGNFTGGCDYQQKILQCANTLYGKYCSSQLGNAMCDATRALDTILYPECTNLTCL